VRHHAAVQARVTHNTPAGVGAAEAAALAVHYCHHGVGPVSGVAGWVSTQLGVDWTRPWQGKVGAKGEMSVRAALTALAAATSQSELLRACIAYTGDVDTVATIALAAASRTEEVTADLPAPLVAGLENGAYGRDHLRSLDVQLGC
jgi:ADP-ribosylglycohydrolase